MPYDKNGKFIASGSNPSYPGGTNPAIRTPGPKGPVGGNNRPRGAVALQEKLGKGGVKGKTLPKIGSLSITEQQKRLKAAGFNVTVDGIEGPQTKMARKALLNGVSASYWNKVWLKNHGSAGKQSGQASGGSSGSSDKSGKPSGTETTKVVTKPTGAASPATPTPEAFDPNAYAQNAANAEFNPQIADARYNLKYAERALPEALKDLQGWNQQVIDTANKYGGTAGYDQGLAGLAGSQVGGLFGGAYAPEAAAQAAPAADMMLQNKASQGGFQDIMKAVFEAQGRDYARRATREGNVDIEKARMGLSGLIAGKGQAHAKYLSEGQQRAQDMAINQQALDQARALAGGEQAIQAAKAKVAQTEAANAPKMADLQFKQAKLEFDKVAQGSKEGLDDPAYVAGLSGALVKAIAGEAGGLRINPKNVMSVLGSFVSQYPGLVGDPRIMNIINATIRQVLAVSHSKNQWTAWSLGKNGLVLNKKKALANAEAARKRREGK